MSYTIFWNGVWITQKPLPGVDPSFTDSTFWIGAVAYAKAKSEGQAEADAHWAAESAMYVSQGTAMTS